MNTEQALIDAFRSFELIHAGLAGGAAADADTAKARIIARFRESADAPDVQEFQYSVKNDWESLVLHALLKRYGIKPYRYQKQRQSTVMIRVSKTVMNGLLWPIFTQVRNGLYTRFSQVTTTLLPEIAAGPYSIPVLPHEHSEGRLCEDCKRRLLEQT